MIPSKRIHFVQHPIIAHYLEMINDRWRNSFFRDALYKYAPGKVVLDVGTGTGILSHYALSANAKFVYAVEQNAQSAAFVDAVLSKNFDRSRFKVIHGNFFTDDIDTSIIDQPVDVLVSELVGPGLFDQGQVHAWHCAKPYLKHNAISIPDRLSCDLWGWENNLKVMVQAQPAKRPGPDRQQALYADACIDQKFVDSLAAMDQAYKNQKTLSHPMQWGLINAIDAEPTWSMTNVVVHGLDCMPKLEFSDLPYPQHIKPKIEFDFELASPAAVAIVKKMHFENHVLYIKDARHMPWRVNPMFQLPTAGKYSMRYNNYQLQHIYEQEWACNLISK